MTNPYSVLGVSPDASDEDVKKAYRDLARKYHPDNYHDNPLADLAQEKMKEINEAYDEITKQRAGGGNSSSGYSGGYSSGGYSGGTTPEFQRIRAAINAGNLDLAEQLLNSMSTRSAEWYFLMGSMYYRRGWLDEARRYFQSAVQMEPGNAEYAQALAMMNGAGAAYRPYGTRAVSDSGCDMCDICTTMMCLNMCCNCR